MASGLACTLMQSLLHDVTDGTRTNTILGRPSPPLSTAWSCCVAGFGPPPSPLAEWTRHVWCDALYAPSLHCVWGCLLGCCLLQPAWVTVCLCCTGALHGRWQGLLLHRIRRVPEHVPAARARVSGRDQRPCLAAAVSGARAATDIAGIHGQAAERIHQRAATRARDQPVLLAPDVSVNVSPPT
eukprot:COSAG01_NODE_6337_length_3729_cov_4.257025_5_plen_184_part_00